MSKKITLNVQEREDHGNGPARRLRREGRIPAVIYSKGDAGRTVSLCAQEYRPYCHKEIHLLDLVCDGKRTLALQKEVQFDYLKNRVIHIDFQEVQLDEVIHAQVAIHTSGVPVGESAGGVLSVLTHDVTVACQAGILPDSITVDVSAMNVGDTISLAQLTVAQGVKLIGDEHAVIIAVTDPAAESAEDASAETQAAE